MLPQFCRHPSEGKQKSFSFLEKRGACPTRRGATGRAAHQRALGLRLSRRQRSLEDEREKHALICCLLSSPHQKRWWHRPLPRAGPPLAGRLVAVGVTGRRTLLAAQARSVHELGPGSLQAPGGAVSHGEDAPGTQVWRGKQPRGQETQREPPLARAAAARCPAPCMASQSVSFPCSFLPSSLFLYPKAPLRTSALLPACWPPMRCCVPSSPCLPRDLSAGCRRCRGAPSWHNFPLSLIHI